MSTDREDRILFFDFSGLNCQGGFRFCMTDYNLWNSIPITIRDNCWSPQISSVLIWPIVYSRQWPKNPDPINNGSYFYLCDDWCSIKLNSTLFSDPDDPFNATVRVSLMPEGGNDFGAGTDYYIDQTPFIGVGTGPLNNTSTDMTVFEPIELDGSDYSLRVRATTSTPDPTNIEMSVSGQYTSSDFAYYNNTFSSPAITADFTVLNNGVNCDVVSPGACELSNDVDVVEQHCGFNSVFQIIATNLGTFEKIEWSSTSSLVNWYETVTFDDRVLANVMGAKPITLPITIKVYTGNSSGCVSKKTFNVTFENSYDTCD